MRITYYHRTLGDGAEGVHIEAVVHALRALGHEVQVVAPAMAATSSNTPSPNAAIKARLPKLVFEAAALFYNLPTFGRLLRATGQFRPDFIYARHARFDVAALAVARRRSVPIVLEVNCLYSQEPYSNFEPIALHWPARTLERLALRMASVVLAVSSPLAAQVRALADVDALVLPNGADPALFDVGHALPDAVRSRYNLGKFTVGWTGILREWHGLDLLLNAIALLPGATLLVVGDGPARQAIERQAQLLGIHERVIITGRVPHAEAANYCAAMDVAVVADDRTGVASPMKLLEYMAMSRAVVAPAADNFRDVITDGLDGVLFERGSATDLAWHLKRLAADDGLRRSLGRRARHKVESERNWLSIARRVVSSLRPFVGGR